MQGKLQIHNIKNQSTFNTMRYNIAKMLPTIITQILSTFSTLFIIFVCVFTHELGHYAALRSVGVVPPSFWIGFGPEVVSFTDKKGTQWCLNLLPIGGAVYQDLSALKRTTQIFVALAGPAANFLLSFLILYYLELSQNTDLQIIQKTHKAFSVFCSKLHLQFTALGNLLYKIMTCDFQKSVSQLSGPIQIINIIRQAKSSLLTICNLGIALGSFNLLPILPLDGGRILFAIAGIDPENDSKLSIILFRVSLAIFIFLVGMAYFSDIVRAIS